MSTGRPVRADAVVVGAGHNGLVAAALLARAGRSVVVLERSSQAGGAAVSAAPFPGVDARLSRYAYLVSLLPAQLMRTLGIAVKLRRRPASSYTPAGRSGLLVDAAGAIVSDSARSLALDPADVVGWERLHATLSNLGQRVFPTLTERLRDPGSLRRHLGDDVAWGLFEAPLSELLERTFSSDLLRGLVLTDALIGTFAGARDVGLRQNRCFLYHVIGNGTGRWDVPVGGMGALADALTRSALGAGAQLKTDAEVVSIATDGPDAEVRCADGASIRARHVLAAVAPAVLAALLGEPAPSAPTPEGSQLKLNMLVKRLPRLRDRAVSRELAFAGTFHVNEGYEQLQQAYEGAAAGRIPRLPPCELYCHSLTDPSILSPELRAAGAHALTLFGLHMPARLFRDDPAGAKRAAVAATLRSVNTVLAEPIEECLWQTPDGAPCLEALTPPELESELAMPGGHIFHRDLSWPFAESAADAGAWGVETDRANVWLCGAGARRGGGVSGIPGHNAVRAVLAAG